VFVFSYMVAGAGYQTNYFTFANAPHTGSSAACGNGLLDVSNGMGVLVIENDYAIVAEWRLGQTAILHLHEFVFLSNQQA
jgi:hypothetical protein